MDIYRCLIPDCDRKLRSFQVSRTKRQVNALSYIIPLPSMYEDTDIGLGTNAEIDIKT